MQTKEKLKNIKTPAYILDERLLRANLELLKSISLQSGAKILLALKAFSFTKALSVVDEYLDGACASGLWEAKLAKKYMKKDIHTYSPAFSTNDFDEINELSSHIVFNSSSQLESFKNKCLDKELALRCNLELSLASNDLYNPCASFSRLGIRAKDLQKLDLSPISGLHFHALCEQDADAFELVLKEFEKKFSSFFKALSWVNFGGGQLITKKGYNTKKLIRLCNDFSQKYGLQVYLEPGEAIAWQCGCLATSVLDIVENEKKIAILDTSAEAHMPDTIIMPYTSEVKDANILASKEDLKDKKRDLKHKNAYILAGNTCLAGDVMGEYAFKKPLEKNDIIYFLDQIHYTIVKNTSFNGIKLPSLVFLRENGELEIKDFFYDDFERRN